MQLTTFLSVATLGSLVGAMPSLHFSPIDSNPVARPFIGASLAIQPDLTSFFGIFRRQGCPMMTLSCPSGGCCSYEDNTSCCGDTCCDLGYACSGGTPTAPCCVAYDSLDNTCGGSTGNPCTTPGDVPCTGINMCCPEGDLCYFDSSGVPRCSSDSGPEPSSPPSTTPSFTPSPISDPITSPSPAYWPSTSLEYSPEASPEATPWSSPESSPTSSPWYSPSPSPSPVPGHAASGFWTSATIGGIAGGGAGGLLLISILIWCCCRNSRRCGKSRHRDLPRVVPLTDQQIYWLIKDFDSPTEWQNAYLVEAKRIPKDSSIDPAPWLNDFASRAVNLRVQQLRSGGARNASMIKAGFFGAIPIVSSFVGLFRDSTKTFRLVAINSLGLGDSEQIDSLRAQAKEVVRTTVTTRVKKGGEWVATHAFEHWWNNSDFAAEVQQRMMAEVTNEFGAQAAQEFWSHVVHLKPAIGQAISAGRAAYACDEKMMKALAWLEPVALKFHLDVFVVNAVAEVFDE